MVIELRSIAGHRGTCATAGFAGHSGICATVGFAGHRGTCATIGAAAVSTFLQFALSTLVDRGGVVGADADDAEVAQAVGILL